MSYIYLETSRMGAPYIYDISHLRVKMDLQEVGGGRGDWMELAQDRGRWRALVGTVRYFSGSINAGNFLTNCKVYWLASQEGLCSME